MFLFERKISLPNKDKVPQVRKQFNVDKNIANIPHDILIQLFINAVAMIEENKYSSSEYQSIKEQVFNKQKIIDDLFEELEEEIDLGIYK